MIIKPWHICILVPAHNEELLLPRCLNSILQACTSIPAMHTVDIILTVDSCSDQTHAIGTEILAEKGAVLPIKKANVGSARKYAALTALNRYKGALDQCWLANTDADCQVPLNWLTHQLTHANTGVHGIAGIVKVDSYKEHTQDAAKKFEKSYTIHPDGSHPHIHGANLGIRADIYKKIGGWNELITAEDHDLWNRLSLSEINKISDASLFVYTSGRKVGRAPQGFANKLASYNGKTDA